MNTDFNSLNWHDAELLSINIDRANADNESSNKDTVEMSVEWPDRNRSIITFHDCYSLNLNMNFGIIAKETIRTAECLTESSEITRIKEEWFDVSISLDHLKCFRINTNSTNSTIQIYAMSYSCS